MGDTRTALYALRIAIQALDSLDERLGEISRVPVVNANINVQLHEEYVELKAAVIGTICADCRKRLMEKLHEISQQ